MPNIRNGIMTRFGCWNVRTLNQDGKLEQLSAEAERLNVDIIGLSETKRNGIGETLDKNGNLLLYSGMPSEDDRHMRGVGIYIRKIFAKSLLSWKAISERIIIARFKSKYKNMTLVQCYAPTEDSDITYKENFYSQLDGTLLEVPKTDVVILMGDFNAQLGPDNTNYETIMGRNAAGRRTENGELMLQLCSTHDLKICGSVFPHKVHHKVTWVSPAGNAENQIDHICVSRSFFNIVCDVRNKRSADIGSDHHLLIAEIKYKFYPRIQKRRIGPTKKYNISRLKNESIKREVKEKINGIISPTPVVNGNIDETWSQIREQIQTICAQSLGYERHESAEWLSNDTWCLITERRSIKEKINSCNNEVHKRALQISYNKLSKNIKKQVKKDKQKFFESLGDEAQTAASKGDLRELYKVTRRISGKKNDNKVPVENEFGVLVTSKEDQLEVWRRHFENTLNVIHEENHERLLIERGRVYTSHINSDPPDSNEICNAIKSLKCGRAVGSDGIPAELFKTCPEVLGPLLYPLFQHIWIHEDIPNEWKESIIIKIPKKGSKAKCSNWRGISVLPAITKIINNIILNRIATPLNNLIRKNQAGFRPENSCIDHINTMRIIIEQSAELNSPLYIAFVDYEKAFDSLKRDVIWRALESRGVPVKIINIIKKFYEGASSRVLHEGQLSEPFVTISGVKQGCALSPLLFITTLDLIFDVVTKESTGLNWRINERLCDLAYADDVILLSTKHQDMQNMIDKMVTESGKLGLKINTKKTKSMRVNVNNATPFVINNEDMENVEIFEYLGSKLEPNGGTQTDVSSRIQKANGAFASLNRVWTATTITRQTKIKIFNACVKTVLLYGSESWHITNDITSKLQVFINRCLRRMLGIFWPRTISNDRLWKLTYQQPIQSDMKRRKYNWLGHTLRKNTNSIAHSALEWNPQGRRSRGRPKTTWRMTILKETSKSISELRYIAKRRDNWKIYVDRLSS